MHQDCNQWNQDSRPLWYYRRQGVGMHNLCDSLYLLTTRQTLTNILSLSHAFNVSLLPVCLSAVTDCLSLPVSNAQHILTTDALTPQMNPADA